jgi:hypothetical protein
VPSEFLHEHSIAIDLVADVVDEFLDLAAGYLPLRVTQH